ncbi:phosphatase PAP2 family protein [Amycolatopsis sp. NPDC058986]|uniref:phosphatase PAP2 family protein n=1 Tax=unclassified Amycolatopsis TaxID=2618356 RepID=UPI00366C00F0
MLFDVINGLAGHSAALDAVMKFVAGPLIYVLVVAGGLIVLWTMRGRALADNLWLAGQVGAALALGFVVNRVLRAFAVHERPFETRPVHQLVQHEPGVSFPSNHATAAMTIAFVVGFFVSKRWGWLLGVPAALIAISRVYVGVHWPSDIIFGTLVGLAATLAVWWAAPRVRERVEERFAKPAPAEPSDRVPSAEADTVIIPRRREAPPRQAPPQRQGTAPRPIAPRRPSEAETVVFRRVRR